MSLFFLKKKIKLLIPINLIKDKDKEWLKVSRQEKTLKFFSKYLFQIKSARFNIFFTQIIFYSINIYILFRIEKKYF